jgi:hypothetical protein
VTFISGGTVIILTFSLASGKHSQYQNSLALIKSQTNKILKKYPMGYIGFYFYVFIIYVYKNYLRKKYLIYKS